MAQGARWVAAVGGGVARRAIRSARAGAGRARGAITHRGWVARGCCLVCGVPKPDQPPASPATGRLHWKIAAALTAALRGDPIEHGNISLRCGATGVSRKSGNGQPVRLRECVGGEQTDGLRPSVVTALRRAIICLLTGTENVICCLCS
jgi:hypothetical protein